MVARPNVGSTKSLFDWELSICKLINTHRKYRYGSDHVDK